MTKQDIINAYVWIRKNNNTIPDNVLDFMKRSAIDSLDSKWIKIESENDLPKNTKFHEFHVYAHDGVFIDNENIGIDSWWGNDEDKKNDWLSNYSHYQPIQKPEPPIF